MGRGGRGSSHQREPGEEDKKVEESRVYRLEVRVEDRLQRATGYNPLGRDRF